MSELDKSILEFIKAHFADVEQKLAHIHTAKMFEGFIKTGVMPTVPNQHIFGKDEEKQSKKRFLRQVQLIEMLHFDMDTRVIITYTHEHGAVWSWIAYYNNQKILSEERIVLQDMDIEAMMRTARTIVLRYLNHLQFEDTEDA